MKIIYDHSESKETWAEEIWRWQFLTFAENVSSLAVIKIHWNLYFLSHCPETSMHIEISDLSLSFLICMVVMGQWLKCTEYRDNKTTSSFRGRSAMPNLHISLITDFLWGPAPGYFLYLPLKKKNPTAIFTFTMDLSLQYLFFDTQCPQCFWLNDTQQPSTRKTEERLWVRGVIAWRHCLTSCAWCLALTMYWCREVFT